MCMSMGIIVHDIRGVSNNWGVICNKYILLRQKGGEMDIQNDRKRELNMFLQKPLDTDLTFLSQLTVWHC